MLIQTLTKGPEKVFVVVKNGDAGAMVKGQICVWSMDGTDDGIDVEDISAAKNPLVVGTTDAAIPVGEYGLVQVYGLDDDAIVQDHGIATNSNIAVGDVFKLDSTIEGLSATINGAAWNTAIASNSVVGFPMFVAAEVVTSGGAATGSTTAKVFIRCL